MTDWREFLIAAKGPKVGLYALRHTHASMLIAANVHRRDIVGLLERLTRRGFRTALTLEVAGDPLDQHADVPPYSPYDHLRLQLLGYVTTSIGMVIHKPEQPA